MIFKENALDRATYDALRQSVGWVTYPEEQTRQALESTCYSLVACDGDRPVAMGRVIGDGLYYLIADVVVAPELQGQGVGTELMQRLIRAIKERTPAGSRSSIQLISVAGKEHFYEKQGLERLPNDRCGCGMRRIVHKEVR